ncbi:hypothetical protein A3715_20110 [Oleiphilus sp. HI0009]|nr:hypothetical protein A3715_20110 [Oleiphilus sp. HI0009]
MAQISGLKAGKVFHKMVNLHIYEDQIDLIRKQIERTPFKEPSFHMTSDIKSLYDIETWMNPQSKEEFWVEGYEHHEPIHFPFAA